MLDFMGEANAAALVGLLGGVLLGLAARIGRFCTLGAIEDALYSSDDRRLRMWAVAIGVAILGTQSAIGAGLLDPGVSPYLDQRWNPLGTIVGGLMFGYGMALSGNCGYGALARLGGGDLRSFVIVLVMGLSTYVAMSGPLAQLRVTLFPVIEGSAHLQGALTPLRAAFGEAAWIAAASIGLVLVGFALTSRAMRASPSHVIWGAVVGLAIVSGWLGTQWIADHGFAAEPIQSHSFAAPLGDTMFYLMTASGTALSFSVGSVTGVVLGAFLGSLRKGRFRWEACEDPRELRRQMLGAALMGPGAVLAVGCSVGQGLSAFSLLAYSAPVACLAIFAGAALGLRQLIVGFAPAE
ncbi:MAG: YeeE/YedE family protein [Rhodobacteraceae bacterium]|nr:MAG: YeeE/YedE family protein [Paracoccaceae bacterium]